MSDDRLCNVSKRGVFLPAYLMLLCLGYPLSTGPVALFIQWGWLPHGSSFLTLFYQPLFYVTGQLPQLDTIFNEYMCLWAELVK